MSAVEKAQTTAITSTLSQEVNRAVAFIGKRFAWDKEKGWDIYGDEGTTLRRALFIEVGEERFGIELSPRASSDLSEMINSSALIDRMIRSGGSDNIVCTFESVLEDSSRKQIFYRLSFKARELDQLEINPLGR